MRVFNLSKIKLLEILERFDRSLTVRQIAVNTGLTYGYVRSRCYDFTRYKHKLLVRRVQAGMHGPVYAYQLSANGRARLRWFEEMQPDLYDRAIAEVNEYRQATLRAREHVE